MSEGSRVQFEVHCNICNKTVTAFPVSNRADLILALEKGRDLRVMHTATEGDHIWSLDAQAMQNLRGAIEKGLV